MRVTVNDSPIDIKAETTIHQLLQQLDKSPLGMAIAINQVIQPRTGWHNYSLQNGDNILLFQAIAGG